MPKQQLHRRFSEKQIGYFVREYVQRRLRAKEVCRYLDIGRTRLYRLGLKYKRSEMFTFKT